MSPYLFSKCSTGHCPSRNKILSPKNYCSFCVVNSSEKEDCSSINKNRVSANDRFVQQFVLISFAFRSRRRNCNHKKDDCMRGNCEHNFRIICWKSIFPLLFYIRLLPLLTLQKWSHWRMNVIRSPLQIYPLLPLLGGCITLLVFDLTETQVCVFHFQFVSRSVRM